MRKVLLAPGVESSVLGFGCAPILGSVGARSARQALGCALDAGINHFDVARVYGYGQAERLVGSFLKGRRGELVIASKCGLEATPLAAVLRPLKPVVRWWRSGSPSGTVAAATGRRDTRLMRHVPITAKEMERSLECSLRALGTDYLDVFLLHEPDWGVLDWNSVAESAQKLKREGKIRAFGAAFYRTEGLPADPAAGCLDVWQFDCPRAGADYESVQRARGQCANVLFSPFRAMHAAVNGGDTLERLWRDFPQSVILSSMFNPDHIRENAAKAA